jgi:enoyl-[acyl-carrier protein] reductase I
MITHPKQTIAIFGIASSRSLGYHIAQYFLQQSNHYRVIIGCKDDKLLQKTKNELFPNHDKILFTTCDVDSNESLDECFSRNLQGEQIDTLIHAIAFAPVKALKLSKIYDLERDDFIRTMSISAYSLPALTKRALPLFNKEKGGSIISLTFDASQHVVQGYGTMAPAKAALETFTRYLAADLGEFNIRVNCVSPGPVNTPAARGLVGFHELMQHAIQSSPLKRGITHEEVAQVVGFLSSNQAKGITGQIIRVDAGISIT